MRKSVDSCVTWHHFWLCCSTIKCWSLFCPSLIRRFCWKVLMWSTHSAWKEWYSPSNIWQQSRTAIRCCICMDFCYWTLSATFYCISIYRTCSLANAAHPNHFTFPLCHRIIAMAVAAKSIRAAATKTPIRSSMWRIRAMWRCGFVVSPKCSRNSVAKRILPSTIYQLIF